MFTNGLSPAGSKDEMTIFGSQVNEGDAAHGSRLKLSLFCQPDRRFRAEIGSFRCDPAGLGLTAALFQLRQ
jgi:hypothetical protein